MKQLNPLFFISLLLGFSSHHVWSGVCFSSQAMPKAVVNMPEQKAAVNYPLVRQKLSREQERIMANNLRSAAEAGDCIRVGQILAAGIDPDAVRVSSVITPLVVAVDKNHIEVVRLLLKAKAEPNYPDSGGVPLLSVAFSRGYNDIGQLLIDSNAQPEACRHKHSLDFILERKINNRDILNVEPLIKAKADIESVDENGNTKLLQAAIIDHSLLVILLGAKANLQHRNKAGKDIVDLVISNNHISVAALVKHGGSSLRIGQRERIKKYAEHHCYKNIIQHIIELPAEYSDIIDEINKFQKEFSIDLAVFLCLIVDYIRE